MSMQSDTFFRAIAEFLAANTASKSVLLAMGSPIAQEWRDMRTAAGLFGHPTVKEAEQQIRKVLCEDLVQRAALEKCHAVLSGNDMNKQALIDALTAATEALK